MAGTADTSWDGPPTTPPGPEAPSLPLYLAGAVIALCAVFAADATLVRPDYDWLKNGLLLVGLGFVFSYGSRRLSIRPQIVDFGFAAVLLLLLAGIAGGQIALEQFLPVGADAPNLHIIVVLAWGTIVWAWALRSDNRVLGMAVPSMAVLGLAASVDLNDPVLVCFGVFIVTVVFLLIHQNFLQNRARATAEARAAAPPRLLLAQFAQAGLCSLAVLLIGSVVIIPAQAVFSRLSLAQAIRQLVSIKSPGLPGSAALRFSDDDNLDIGTGAAWPTSAEVMMQVTPSDGQEHYWRGRTYDLYTGAGWQSTLEQQQAPADGPAQDGDRLRYGIRPDLTPGDGDRADAPLMTTRFQVFGETDQFYYAAGPRQILLRPDAIRYSPGVRVYRDGRLDLFANPPVRLPYDVVSASAPDAARPEVQALLRRAGTDYPLPVRRLYLGVVGNGVTQAEDVDFFRQSVAEAVQTLPPDRRDPLDEALALRDWVSRRCVYSLAPPPISEDDDHVRTFLRDNRRGYCDLFASSLAILCRTAGIPARLATGFAPGDPNGGSYNLRGEDKHAWTEVYFPGAGWVALDATVGSTTDGSVPSARKPGRGGWPGWLTRLRAGLGGSWALVFPLLAGIVLIVGTVLKTELYDRWRAGRPGASRSDPALTPAPGTALGHRYARLARALARLGLARRPSETPAEHAARVTGRLPALEREFGVSLSRPLVTSLAAAFTQVCYARPGAPAGEAETWDGALARFEAASWRAFGIRLWRRLARRS